MDDLDHSMRIAEEDWSTFYLESEECCVPQPLLARLDPSSSVFDEASAASNSQGAEGGREEAINTDDKVQVSDYAGLTLLREEVHVTAEHIPEETRRCIISTLEAVVRDVARSLEADVRCQDAGGVPLRAEEKERWFVTVNDGPVPRRARAAPVKKKTKTKKEHKKKCVCRTDQEPMEDNDGVQTHRERSQHDHGIMANNKEEILHDDDDVLQNNRKGTQLTLTAEAPETMQDEDIMKSSIEGTLHNDKEILHGDDIMQNNREGTLHDGDIMQRNKEGTLHEVDIQRNSEGTLHEDDIMQRNREGTLHEDDIMQRNREEILNEVDIMQRNREETPHEVDIMRRNREETLHEVDIIQRNREGTLHEDDIQRNREGTLHEDDIMQRNREGTLHENDIMQRNREGTLHEDDIMQRNREGTLHEDDIMQRNREETLHDEDIMQRNREETLHDEDIMQRNREGTLHEDDIMQRNREGTLHFERVDSDAFLDSSEFFALQSSGSESYLSAADSLDLLEEDFFKNQQPECSALSPSCSSHPNVSSGSESLHTRGAATCSDQAGVGKNSMPDSDTHSSRTVDASGETELLVCGGSPRAQPLPEVIVTPVADSPEAYAQAAGQKSCVYAISAFWDEMEKLTINDILQLRMVRSPTPTETSHIPTQCSPLVDPEEHHLTHEGFADMSDTADSDYFTQVDDSKADRSSWDFSVCDFEEDYWQFLGTSRNTSPDLSSKSKEAEIEEEEGTRRQTSVPEGNFAGPQRIQRRMTKTKSMHNVQAFNTEELSLEASLHTSEMRVHGDALEPFTQGMVESLECMDHDASFPSHKWKPIPIFSCSHPTVRELTLPEWDHPFLTADAISPTRVVLHPHLRVGGMIRYSDNGSIWCRRSGQTEELSILVSRLERDLHPECEQQRIPGTVQAPARVVQQSDLCLVCIAFASWVLTSSDAESSDAWKAALLANVSALSAIRYLRQKRRR